MTEGPLPGGNETLLVVDDDDDIRESVTRILERLGYKVLQAADPEQALKAATLSSVDLLLIDVVLPQMSGLTLAHKIASLLPRVRVLYMSGYTTKEVLDDHGDQEPGVGFLQKPFTPRQIASRIRELLDAAPTEQQAVAPVVKGSETILVVDDDEVLRSTMVRGLRRLDYTVLQADRPATALKIAADAPVELVVMDVVLPEQSGIALAHAISSQRPGMCFLYVSGLTSEEVLEGQVIKEPGIGFLSKPFTPEELGRAVRALLDAKAEAG